MEHLISLRNISGSIPTSTPKWKTLMRMMNKTMMVSAFLNKITHYQLDNGDDDDDLDK